MEKCLPCEERFKPIYDANRVISAIKDVKDGVHYPPDSSCLLRARFFGIFFRNILLVIPHFYYRFDRLICGSFIERGKLRALDEFTLEMLANPALRGTPLPFKNRLYAIAKEGGKELGKFALWIFCFPILAFISIMGLGCPLVARTFYTKVDRFYYLPPLDKFSPATPFERLANLTAPCLQPKEVWKQEHLFRNRPSETLSLQDRYKTERSRFLEIFEKAKRYFPSHRPLRVIHTFFAQKEPASIDYTKLLPDLKNSQEALTEAISSFQGNSSFNPSPLLDRAVQHITALQKILSPPPLF